MNNLNDIFFTPAANQDLTYDQVLEDVQRYFAENHASTIAEAGEGNAERATTLLKELMVQYIVKRKYAIEGLTTEELCEKLYEDMAGYSFLKKWIYKPGIEEVNINAYNDIEVIEAGGRSIKIPDKFSSPQHAIDVVRRMLNACGMVIDDTMPSVVGFLDKNIRISVDKTPIVDPDVGINASIRIVNQQTVSEQKLLDSGSATAEMLHFLMACIRYGVSVCIAGSTGSGKTTIMAWLLSNVPNNQRLTVLPCKCFLLGWYLLRRRTTPMDEQQHNALELPKGLYEPALRQPMELDFLLGQELSLCFHDLDGSHVFKTCYGDICKAVNALRDYARLLEMACEQWDLTGFHRALYEYHAEKMREIAGKFQAGIGYDYDAAMEKCRRKKKRKKKEDDFGEDALVLAFKRTKQPAEQMKEADTDVDDSPWEEDEDEQESDD